MRDSTNHFEQSFQINVLHHLSQHQPKSAVKYVLVPGHTGQCTQLPRLHHIPRAVIDEALAAGLPIISSDGGALAVEAIPPPEASLTDPISIVITPGDGQGAPSSGHRYEVPEAGDNAR